MSKERELANDLIHTNSEYEKLKSANADSGRSPRETPAQQGPGGRGYDKAQFDQWTREELQTHLSQLGIETADDADREQMIAAIEARNGARQR